MARWHELLVEELIFSLLAGILAVFWRPWRGRDILAGDEPFGQATSPLRLSIAPSKTRKMSSLMGCACEKWEPFWSRKKIHSWSSFGVDEA